MAEIVKSDVIVPEIYEESLKGAFAGMSVFGGSPAVIVKPGLPSTVRGGDTVKVPKWSTFGSFSELAEGDAIVPVGIAQTSEEAVVKRYGAGISMSAWAQMAALEDPYAEASRQLRVGAERAAEARLLTVAQAAGADLLSYDISGTGNGKLSYDALVEALGQFGDEEKDIVSIAVHPTILAQFRKLKSSDGTPQFVNAVNGGAPTFMGYPMIVSELLAPSVSVYPTLILRRGALALWYASQPKVENDRTPATDEDTIYVNTYFAAHRYSRVGGGTKGGICVLKTK